MNYDICHSSITYFPLLPLSKTVSFERKVLDIRQMPAQVLFPHWDDEFEFIYVLSGMMEFRVRQKAFLVSSGEGFFLNTGEIHSACAYQSYDCRFVIYRICPSVLFLFYAAALFCPSIICLHSASSSFIHSVP